MTDSSAASRSLWTIAATVILASITHAWDFGHPAFVAGAIVLAILYALNRAYRRTGSRLSLVFYLLLILWIVGAFGVVGGLWNHAVKLAVSVANGGALPPSMERLFMSPDLGGAGYEATWILMGVAGVVAAWFGYRFARTARWTAP